MKETIAGIINISQGTKYMRFGNSDGKSWVVPIRNMHTALNLYQPSSAKGRLVKNLLPWMHRLQPLRKAIRAESLDCTLQPELQELLCRIFGVEGIEFSIFEGTPCVHRKATMQLSLGNDILGYCKASDNNEILTLFERENALLELLHDKGVENIPRPLFCGTLRNGTHIFVQSTKKTARSGVPHKWGTLQEKFLATLRRKTGQRILFEQSDYYKTLTALQEHLTWLPTADDRVVVASALARVLERYCGREVNFSACHGDFTPWNMFVERGELFVFDFEYGALTYPDGIDKCHFELQRLIFEERYTTEQIVAHCAQRSNEEKELLTLYLLDMISRFTLREKGEPGADVLRSLHIWCSVLKNL